MPSESHFRKAPNGRPRISTNPAPTQPFEMFEPTIEIDEGPSLKQRINDILLPDDDEMPDVSQVDMGNDPCCGEAREMWRDGLAEGWGERFTNDPDGGIPILEAYDAMSCEQFRQSLENRFDAQGYSMVQHEGGSNLRNPTRHGMNPSSPRSNHSWEDHLANRVLEAWDKCSESALPTDQASQDMGFYASQDAFEAGWGAVLKAIVGPDNYRYSRFLTPITNYSHKLGRSLPTQAGLSIEGSIPMDEAISAVEDKGDLEGFAESQGWDEEAMEMGWDDPMEYLESIGTHAYESPHYLEQTFAHGERSPTAEEVEVNMEGLGPNWHDVFTATGQEAMLAGLEQLRDQGGKRVYATSGSIGATGAGPMMRVNPFFRGLGLGPATLASLLENTGYAVENMASASGLGTVDSLSRTLAEAQVPHQFNISEEVRRPVQSNDWRHSDFRFPHQGQQQLLLEEPGTLLTANRPTKTLLRPLSIDMMREGEREMSMDQMRALVDSAKRELELYHSMPSRFNDGFDPWKNPTWLDEINWGDN